MQYEEEKHPEMVNTAKLILQPKIELNKEEQQSPESDDRGHHLSNPQLISCSSNVIPPAPQPASSQTEMRADSIASIASQEHTFGMQRKKQNSGSMAITEIPADRVLLYAVNQQSMFFEKSRGGTID